MSPRIKRPRKILNPPVIKGFKPYGSDSANQNTEPVFLLFEEYEALRLCDYDMINHLPASEIMGISRPTFTRIYSAARQKIAKAFVEGRQISIEGGKVYYDSDWYNCNKCGCDFNNPEKEVDNYIRNNHPFALMVSSLGISNKVIDLLLISIIRSSLKSFIMRMTLSVDMLVRSLKSLRDRGKSNSTDLNIFRERQSNISASLP